MRCSRVQDKLLLYLAAELNARETGKIIEHVARCTACKELAEDLATTQYCLESALHTDMVAPDSLDARVMAAIENLPKHRLPSRTVRSFRPGPMSYAATFGLLVISVLGIIGTRIGFGPRQVTLESLGNLHRTIMSERTPDQYLNSVPSQLAKQLTSIAGFRVLVSDLRLEGAHLVGGNCVAAAKPRMVEVHYRWDGKQISLFEMVRASNAPSALRQLGYEPDAYYAHRAAGTAYVAWHSGTTDCVMVSNEVPMHDLFHLACKACERQRFDSALAKL